MAYYFAKSLDAPFDEAVERTVAALKQHGFGVLTRIDVTHEVEGPGVDEAAIRRCVELSAMKYCPVSAMLSAGEIARRQRRRHPHRNVTPARREREQARQDSIRGQHQEHKPGDSPRLDKGQEP